MKNKVKFHQLNLLDHHLREMSKNFIRCWSSQDDDVETTLVLHVHKTKKLYMLYQERLALVKAIFGICPSITPHYEEILSRIKEEINWENQLSKKSKRVCC